MVNSILRFLKMHANLLNRTYYVVSAFMCTNHMKYKRECSHSSTTQDSSLLGCATVCVWYPMLQRHYYTSKHHELHTQQVSHLKETWNIRLHKINTRQSCCQCTCPKISASTPLHIFWYNFILVFYTKAVKEFQLVSTWHSNSTSPTF